MKITKSSETITFITRDDNQKCMIAKVKKSYEVYINGVFTGYSFKSYKKAIEYCEIGF